MATWVHVDTSSHSRRSYWGPAIAHATWKCGTAKCRGMAVTCLINTNEPHPPSSPCGVCKK